jgi:hypothetical protein
VLEKKERAKFEHSADSSHTSCKSLFLHLFFPDPFFPLSLAPCDRPQTGTHQEGNQPDKSNPLGVFTWTSHRLLLNNGIVVEHLRSLAQSDGSSRLRGNEGRNLSATKSSTPDGSFADYSFPLSVQPNTVLEQLSSPAPPHIDFKGYLGNGHYSKLRALNSPIAVERKEGIHRRDSCP